jgi:acetyl-CoA carboxylase biotin carboxyl carrier protein
VSVVEIRSEVTGSVWLVEARLGDAVGEDDTIVILESMKMEIPVVSPEDGELVELRVAEGQPVAEGDLIALLEVT